MDEVNAEDGGTAGPDHGDDKTYETTAGDIGLAVDDEATAEAALDAGRGDSLLNRPFSWLRSFFSARDVDVQYTVSGPQASAKMVELQGADLPPPHDPTISSASRAGRRCPASLARAIDTETVADELPEAAADVDPTGAIEVEVGSAPVAPLHRRRGPEPWPTRPTR